MTKFAIQATVELFEDNSFDILYSNYIHHHNNDGGDDEDMNITLDEIINDEVKGKPIGIYRIIAFGDISYIQDDYYGDWDFCNPLNFLSVVLDEDDEDNQPFTFDL